MPRLVTPLFKMFLAAFISLSCSEEQTGHFQCSTPKTTFGLTIIADKQMENSHNYLLWERAFKSENDEEEIPDSGIDFSNLFPWERKSK